MFKQRLGRWCTVVMMTLLISIAGATVAPAQEAGQKTTVKIGISAPLSGTGAFHGMESTKGVELAAEELNAREDTQYEYTIVPADDECRPDGGRAALTKLTQIDEVNVVITSNCSGAVLGGMSVLQDTETPGLVAAATNPQITEGAGVGGNEYIWRMNSQDAMFARYFARYIADAGAENVAFLATNNDYGRGVVDAFTTEFEALDVEIATEEFIEQGANDYRPMLTAIDAADADAIVAPLNHPDALVALRQMNEMGMDTKFYARADVVSFAFLEKVEDPHLGDGVEEATYWDASLSSDPDFRPSFVAKYGSEPSLNAYMAYWALKVIDEAIRLGGGADSAQVQAGFEAMDFQTPLGRITFDDHHQAQADVFIVGFVDGEIELIERITPTPD